MFKDYSVNKLSHLSSWILASLSSSGHKVSITFNKAPGVGNAERYFFFPACALWNGGKIIILDLITAAIRF